MKRISSNINLKEVIALITLLEDPDEMVYNNVKSKFLFLGLPIIPHLETAWQNTLDTLIQERIDEVIHSIKFKTLKTELKKWTIEKQDDLLSACILIAQYQYPDININKIKQQLESLKQDVWLELSEDIDAIEKIEVINQVFFNIHGFSSNISNYNSPQNSFLNIVLETKKGSPVMLAVIYMLICKELDIPVYGVNLPKHFILAYVNDFANLISPFDNTLDQNILFYLNPFSKGIIFKKDDISTFIKQLELKTQPSYFLPCSTIDIVKLILENLIQSYSYLGHQNKVADLHQLVKVLATT